MKFEVSTKPLIDGLNLAIINSNISQFNQKSCVVQISADANSLRVNTEVPFILSEITLKGKSDISDLAVVFVDSVNFKQLVSTLDSSTVTFEFVEGGLVLHSGKSKFTLPALNQDSELTFNRPNEQSIHSSEEVKVDKVGWKFISDHQLYAVSMSYITPVYTKVWMGENGDVLTGDYNTSMFTHSTKGNMKKTCLVSDTIVHLFNTIPDDSKMYEVDNDFIIKSVTDGYTYVAQFTPQYEDDEEVGTYNSEMILEMFPDSSADKIKLACSAIKKVLNQSLILVSDSKTPINISYNGNSLHIHDDNVDVNLDVDGKCMDFDLNFSSKAFQSVIKSYEDESIGLCPLVVEDEVAGIAVCGSDLTTIVAAVDEE